MPSCEGAIEWLTVDCGRLPAAAEVARFRGNNGTMECHITVRLTGEGTTTGQLSALGQAYQRALDSVEIEASSALFRRVFCSDVVNQAGLLGGPALDSLLGASGPCADSLLGQPPAPSAKFALWAYHLCDPSGPVGKSGDNRTVSYRRGGLTHFWSTRLTDCQASDSHGQTRRILDNYNRWLTSRGMTLADHVVRTWWFVQNIDADYQGLVDSRREFFTNHGLTPETHYLASTGIAGTQPEIAAKVALDTYAIGGLLPGQLEFLRAPGNLCPTHDYGVTFERATAVSYADRRHVLVSGTASIDAAGSILHHGDILGQLERTLVNIEALLATTNANLGDLASILVYLRDPADAVVVETALRKRLGMVPFVMVTAPVCRPGWLIEIEGIALVPACYPELPEF